MKRVQTADFTPTSADGFTKRMLRESPNGLVFTLTFAPGQQLKPHTHEQSDLTVLVLEGEGEATVAGRRERLLGGTVLLCDGAEAFGVENNGPGRLSLFVVLHPAPADRRFAGDIR